MGIEEKTIGVITRLIRLTRERKIDWTPTDAAALAYPGDGPIGLAYTAQFEGKRIAVFEIGYKDYSEDTDEWYMTARSVVAFVDARNRLEWEFPRVANTHDLLEAVQFRSAGVEDFFDKVLGKKDE